MVVLKKIKKIETKIYFFCEKINTKKKFKINTR